jgi:transposase
VSTRPYTSRPSADGSSLRRANRARRKARHSRHQSEWIGDLYAIDERAGGDLEKKAELRREESAEVIATMKTWLWSQASLKTLSIGNAAAYVVANWDRLTRFLEDARIPLDNNATVSALQKAREFGPSAGAG